MVGDVIQVREPLVLEVHSFEFNLCIAKKQKKEWRVIC
jgi:hypothetical protein